MRWILLIAAVLLLGSLALLAALAATSRRPRPSPGLVEGRLRPCPGSANCACSEDGGGPAATPALAFTGDAEAALARLARTVVATGGMIDGVSADHLRARYVSSFFGFIDDFEARLDRSTDTLHLRSQSRVGWFDLGVNRRRLQAIRRAFEGA